MTVFGAGRMGMFKAADSGGAPATIAEDARTFHNPGSAADPHTFDHVIGSLSDGILLVKIAHENQSTIQISDVKVGGSGGTSLTLLAGQTGPGSEIRSEIWYGLNPPSGTQQIWIDCTASLLLAAEAVTLSGVEQEAPTSSATQAGTSFPVSTSAMAVAAAGSWKETVVGRTSNGGNYTVTADQGTPSEEQDAAVSTAFQIATSSQSSIAGSSITTTWTSTANGGKPLVAALMRPAT